MTHVRTAAPLSRRTILRGLGAALALPWLEAMAPATARTLGTVAAAPPAPRLLYWFVPIGVQRDAWFPAAEGPLDALSPTLEPLAAFRGRLSVLGGLAADKAKANGDGPGDHARSAAAWLTGVQPLKEDGQVRLGPSADQLVADALEGTTPLRSLAVGCEGSRRSGQCDSGYACAYSTNVSWRTATTPVMKEHRPARLFDRLFRDGETGLAPEDRARRRSVLDFVSEDAARLERRLGAADRQKLDEYRTGLRDIERRLEHLARAGGEIDDELRPTGTPADLGEYARLMVDLLVLGLEQDLARTATFMFTNEGNNRAYRELGIDEGHHGLSHHRGNVEWIDKLKRIERYEVEQFAYLLERLAATADGEGSLLDGTMVCFGSGIADGNRHDHVDLPTLLAGGEAAGLAHVGYRRVEHGTPLNDLHLALMERMGVRPDRFGDGRGPLALG